MNKVKTQSLAELYKTVEHLVNQCEWNKLKTVQEKIDYYESLINEEIHEIENNTTLGE